MQTNMWSRITLLCGNHEDGCHPEMMPHAPAEGSISRGLYGAQTNMFYSCPRYYPSTSAVDTRTDSLIRKGFKEYIPETTKIIIAQRISSVQEADRIIVMDGGRIVDFGTHEELMKSSEIYQEVYESQNKAGDQDE